MLALTTAVSAMKLLCKQKFISCIEVRSSLAFAEAGAGYFLALGINNLL